MLDSLKPLCQTQVNISKGGPRYFSTAEVGTAEVGFAEVWSYVWMLFPPLIPNFYSFFELVEMLLVCHSVSSSFLKPLAALPRLFLTFYYLGVQSIDSAKDGATLASVVSTSQSSCVTSLASSSTSF